MILSLGHSTVTCGIIKILGAIARALLQSIKLESMVVNDYKTEDRENTIVRIQ